MASGIPDYPQTLPANTMVGRLASTAGPTEAIPITSLAAAITLGGAITAIGVGTMTNLRALATPVGLTTVLMLGYAAVGDGGWGIFWWNSADTTADNGGTVIQPNALPATGRWNKL